MRAARYYKFGILLLIGVVLLIGVFGNGTIKALWKFTQEYPHASFLVLLDINQQESQVPSYVLPPILRSVAGAPIASATDWQNNREDLLQEFSRFIYGQTPEEVISVKTRVVESSASALRGKATRQQVTLSFQGHEVTLLIYRPNNILKPVPAFLGLNFRGNHTVSADPSIYLTASWVPIDEENGVFTHQATDANRGQRASRYPIESIIDSGYAFVTAYYGDFYPDHIDGKAASIQTLFAPSEGTSEWGAVGAWSWGMSRMLDYLAEDINIDATKVIAIGHSRLGKAALWAAAQDARFAAAISNNSGAVGAALSRRQFGETVKIITALFPHWFTPKLNDYRDQVDRLPVDQHQLVALLAPRPVYVASASEDLWADPKGEFLSASQAEAAYRLFDKDANNLLTMPAAGEGIAGPISYHLRPGKHDLLEFDWQRYLAFADCYVVMEVACR